MMPIFFKNKDDFRKWLQKNHLKEVEIFVGYYKAGSGKANMSWSESVDVAICFGWIDGIRKSIDNESYCNRFTPRKPASYWSEINIKKAEELIKQNLMMPAGLAAFNNRNKENTKLYSHESEPVQLSQNLEQQFKENEKAWDYFQATTASYKKQAIHWVMSAKQEATILNRLATLIADSEAERKIKLLRR